MLNILPYALQFFDNARNKIDNPRAYYRFREWSESHKQDVPEAEYERLGINCGIWSFDGEINGRFGIAIWPRWWVREAASLTEATHAKLCNMSVVNWETAERAVVCRLHLGRLFERARSLRKLPASDGEHLPEPNCAWIKERLVPELFMKLDAAIDKYEGWT